MGEARKLRKDGTPLSLSAAAAAAAAAAAVVTPLLRTVANPRWSMCAATDAEAGYGRDHLPAKRGMAHARDKPPLATRRKKDIPTTHRSWGC